MEDREYYIKEDGSTSEYEKVSLVARRENGLWFKAYDKDNSIGDNKSNLKEKEVFIQGKRMVNGLWFRPFDKDNRVRFIKTYEESSSNIDIGKEEEDNKSEEEEYEVGNIDEDNNKKDPNKFLLSYFFLLIKLIVRL